MISTPLVTRVGPAPQGDDGFGLVEALVSMVVFTIVMLALVPVQVRALQGVGLARERQTATGFAITAIEGVRAAAQLSGRPAAIGLGRSDTAGDPNLTCPGAGTVCRLTPAVDSTFTTQVAGETVMHSGSDASLTTQRCSTASGCTTSASAAVTGLVYTTRLYVTASTTTSLVNVTAITIWTSTNSHPSATQQAAVRTQLVTS